MHDIDEATTKQMLEQLAFHLARYSIGFLRFTQETDGIDGVAGGTGTLVSIGSVKGILTAAHVVQAVRNEEAGIARVGQGQRRVQSLKLNFKLATPYVLNADAINPKSPEQRAPDLGFLLLPSHDAEILASTHSFYNLDKERSPSLLVHDLGTGVGEVIFGVVSQWTEDLPSPRSDTRTKGINTVLSSGTTSNWRYVDDYDICDFKLDGTRQGREITDYRGMSGGPLWRFAPNASNTEFEIALFGINYWQADVGTDQHRICCHGFESLRALAELVRADAS